MLLKKRVLAFIIDYFIIMSYAAVLLLTTLTLRESLDINTVAIHPIKAQCIGFLSLTLIVFLYFFLSEKSKFKATIGKRIMSLKVVSEDGSLLKRNILKFTPWEVAHTGIYWMLYFEKTQTELLPLWVWFTLIIPQISVVFYFISIIKSSGKSSIYDRLSKTSIIQKQNHDI